MSYWKTLSFRIQSLAHSHNVSKDTNIDLVLPQAIEFLAHSNKNVETFPERVGLLMWSIKLWRFDFRGYSVDALHSVETTPVGILKKFNNKTGKIFPVLI